MKGHQGFAQVEGSKRLGSPDEGLKQKQKDTKTKAELRTPNKSAG